MVGRIMAKVCEVVSKGEVIWNMEGTEGRPLRCGWYGVQGLECTIRQWGS